VRSLAARRFGTRHVDAIGLGLRGLASRGFCAGRFGFGSVGGRLRNLLVDRSASLLVVGDDPGLGLLDDYLLLDDDDLTLLARRFVLGRSGRGRLRG
jgi:hypothetical protein